MIPYFVLQIPTQDFIEVKDCVRSKAEETDRRFCFEVEVATSQGKSVPKLLRCVHMLILPPVVNDMWCKQTLEMIGRHG